jgi:D-lactate dehydrogenase (cytochrome)
MLNDTAELALKALLSPNQVVTDPVELITYEVDAAQDRGLPDGVVFPETSEQVQQLVEWAREYQVPLVARGAGTGLSGGAVAHLGGVIPTFSRMNRILVLDTAGRSAAVESGVVNQVLNENAQSSNLYYPPDPASGQTSTLGGNVAENAGGPHCFKYGVTTNYITGLEVVLADGQIVQLGGPSLDYPGYDLVGLFTGSEGTLGVITKINLRLLRKPPAVRTLMAAFDSVEQAGGSVSAVIAAGLVPATMEMMDQKIARIVEDYAHPGIPTDAGALLIIEVDGYSASLEFQMSEIIRIVTEYGARDLRIAQTSEERDRIWFARKSAAGAIARLAPAYYLVDGTVPRSKLAKALAISNRICNEYELLVGYVFHAGDGNLHPLILMYPEDSEQVARVHQAGHEFMQEVVRLGGSISGEHGVGIEKRSYLSLMYTPEELGVMYDIKRAFDPKNLFNPGKIFPDDVPEITISKPGVTIPIGSFIPATAEEAAEGLSNLASTGQPVEITGKDKNKDSSHRPDHVILSTRRLSGIYDYAPDDLYITAGAGTILSELQVSLEKDGKYLPLLSPWPQSTLGGLLAVNFNAPLRMRYGAIRDQVLAMTIVLVDGRVIHAGRPVVKNVAGYDIPKVMIGSYGTLGLIAEVTFKLNTLPQTRRSLLFPVEKIDQSLTLGSTALSQALVSSAITLSHGIPLSPLIDSENIDIPTYLIYTAEGLLEDVETELEIVRDRLVENGAPEPIVVENFSGNDLWVHLLGANTTEAVKVRSGVPVKDLATYTLKCAKSLKAGAYLVDFANGMLYATASPDGVGEAQAWVDELRKPALAASGYTVILESPSEWGDKLDPWGYTPDALHLMQALKSRWDPAGILNPGTFLQL